MDYLCQVKPNAHSKPYTLKQIDFLAAYVILADVWYLIPAAVLLRGKQKKAVTILPEKAKHRERYKYEAYRESLEAIAACKKSQRQRQRTRVSAPHGHCSVFRKRYLT
jgi:hypothetical protein